MDLCGTSASVAVRFAREHPRSCCHASDGRGKLAALLPPQLCLQCQQPEHLRNGKVRGDPGRIAALQTRVQELQTQQDLQSARLTFVERSNGGSSGCGTCAQYSPGARKSLSAGHSPRQSNAIWEQKACVREVSAHVRGQDVRREQPGVYMLCPRVSAATKAIIDFRPPWHPGWCPRARRVSAKCPRGLKIKAYI